MNIDSTIIFRIVLTHYIHAAFLHCFHYTDICATLLNEFKSVDENIWKLSGNKLRPTLAECCSSSFSSACGSIERTVIIIH